MRIIIVVFSLLNIYLTNYSQSPFIDSSKFGRGHILSIKSKYIKDETYIIKVYLPANFETSNKKYPVLYLLDGDRSYGMVRDMTEWLNSTGEIDPFIIVGICYGENITDLPSRQIRDFTPSRDPTHKSPEYLNAGGAKDFQLFIQKELIPIIESRYPTSEKKVVTGFGYGALFGSYILVSSPKIFTDYVLISPLLLWENKYIFRIEEAFASLHKNINANVILIYGLFDASKEVIIPTNELAEVLQNRKYKDLSVSVRQYAAETHYSVYPIALQYSIMNFFRK